MRQILKGLRPPHQKQEKVLPNSKLLDFNIASGLNMIMTGNFKKQASTAEKHRRLFTVRPIAWIISIGFRKSVGSERTLDYGDLMQVHLHNGNVQSFKNWDEILSAMISKKSRMTIYIYWGVFTGCCLKNFKPEVFYASVPQDIAERNETRTDKKLKQMVRKNVEPNI